MKRLIVLCTILLASTISYGSTLTIVIDDADIPAIKDAVLFAYPDEDLNTSIKVKNKATLIMREEFNKWINQQILNKKKRELHDTFIEKQFVK